MITTSGRVVDVRSNVLTLRIVQADSAWQKSRLDEIRTVLDKPTGGQATSSKARLDALTALRHLGSQEAAIEAAQRLRGEEQGDDWPLACGLMGSPHRSIALAAMNRLLSDPDFPVSGTFLTVLAVLPLDPTASADELRVARAQHAKAALASLMEALPAKRGPAATVSLETAWGSLPKDAPPGVRDPLTAQLVASLERLPPRKQGTLLRYQWDTIRDPRIIPVLRRLAANDGPSAGARGQGSSDALEVSGLALRRWHELDPQGARGSVIAEIVRPKPRFGAAVLGLLPDKALPDIEHTIATHFVQPDHSLDDEQHLASLLARYATTAVLPQVLPKIARLVGTWACAPQTNALAFVLKVDPPTAKPLIARAVAARGPQENGCRRSTLSAIGRIHLDPVLDELAIPALDDTDLEVVADAAQYLGRFGSADAEAELWRRYEAWGRQWAGRAGELHHAPGARNPNETEAGVGYALMRALATGGAWLADEAALRRMTRSAVTASMRQQIESWLMNWEGRPHSINYVPTDPAHFYLAQYQLDSVEALESKLAQFPRGTEFFWAASEPTVSPAQKKVYERVSGWAARRGFVVRRR